MFLFVIQCPFICHVPFGFLFALKRNSFKKARTNGSIFLAVVGVVFQSVISIRKKKKTMKSNKQLVIRNSTIFREEDERLEYDF